MDTNNLSTQLRSSEPEHGNSHCTKNAANLKQFIMIPVLDDYLHEIANTPAFDSWKHLQKFLPNTPIEYVGTSENFVDYNSFDSSNAYISAHRRLHNLPVAPSTTQYLTTGTAYIKHILSIFRRTVKGEMLRDKYLTFDDQSKTIAKENELLNQIKELPEPGKRQGLRCEGKMNVETPRNNSKSGIIDEDSDIFLF